MNAASLHIRFLVTITLIFSNLTLAFGVVGPDRAQEDFTIRVGGVASVANDVLAEAGYQKTQLSMMPLGENQRLSYWVVDCGVLIISYAHPSERILRLSFWMADERPKAIRKTFRMQVDAFDPISGEMTLQLKTPGEEK